MSPSLAKLLQSTIGYEFENDALLSDAMTHRSAKGDHNERMEFLGDAILGFVIGHALYDRFPDEREGTLTHLRSVLVNRQSLAGLARELSLGDYLHLAPSEKRSGGFDRDSILSDALEALVAAIYLDGGMVSVERCVLSWFQSRLNDPTLKDTQKDFKSQLQELCQAKRWPLPTYTLLNSEGKAHALTFTVCCEVEGHAHQVTRQAQTRRQAEQDAAAELLEKLSDE